MDGSIGVRWSGALAAAAGILLLLAVAARPEVGGPAAGAEPAVGAKAEAPKAAQAAKEAEEDVLRLLWDLRRAEETYRAGPPQRECARLDQLAAAGLSLVIENGTDPVSGYRLRSSASGRHYTIVALPPNDDLPVYTLADGMVFRAADDDDPNPGIPYQERLAAERESGSLQILKSLRNAQETYKFRRKQRYANLDELKADGCSPVGEGELEPSTGYRLRSRNVGVDTYIITATPEQPAGGKLTTYELCETGAIKHN